MLDHPITCVGPALTRIGSTCSNECPSSLTLRFVMISECRPYAEKNAVVVYGSSICDELRPQVFAIHRYSTEYRHRPRLFPSRRVWRSIETPTSTDGDITGRNVQPPAQTTAVCQRVRGMAPFICTWHPKMIPSVG